MKIGNRSITMKKYNGFIIILAACLILGACASRSTGQDQGTIPAEFARIIVEQVIPFNSEDPEGLRLELRFNLAEPADSRSGIRDLVRELLYKGQSAADYGDAVIQEHGALYDELRAQWATEEEASDSFNWYYTEDVEGHLVSVKSIIPGYETLLVLTKTTDTYTGGAHGSFSTNSFVVDPAAIKRLTIDDLFSNREELRRLLEAELRRRYELPKGAPLSEAGFFEDQVELPENFFLSQDAPERLSGNSTDGGPFISFLWNAYEIAPYVMGPITATLPLRELSALLRK
jgi:hypothetical protein